MARFFLIVFLSLFWLCQSASADILATFYNHDQRGDRFPHAFFTLDGTLSDGTVIDESHGFTAVYLSPAVLMGSVRGEVQPLSAKYISKSTPRFSLRIGDADYLALHGVVKKWQNISGKSYHLKKRNCVHFAGEAMEAVGITTNPKTEFFKKPRAYMLEVIDLNPTLTIITPRESELNKDIIAAQGDLIAAD